MSDIDSYDLRILRVLAEDGRISWRDLAERIGLSLTPTIRRVRRLEDDGYIQGYRANIEERRLLGGMSVFVSVTVERQTEDVLRRFESKLLDLKEVMSAFLMTGGADYLLRVVVRDLEHYEKLLAEMTRIPGVAHIQSSFAIKPIIRRPAPSV